MKALLIPAVLALAVGTASPIAPVQAKEVAGVPSAARVGELRTAMRKLWEDHITYTRNYIISELADLPDTSAVVDRLMTNQEQIGSAIKPYYGDAAGDQLTKLLKEHIAIAAEVVKAAEAGDKTKLAAEQAKWNANGRDIAAFLSGANPAWPRADLEAMLQKHLDLTTKEVTSRLGGDWAADVGAYDAGHEHMLMFADTLTNGIAKQVPAKVGR
jgi:hypothetical protein